MKPGWPKKLATSFAELLFAIVLVLVFFWILFKALNMIFPFGTSLQMLAGDSFGGGDIDSKRRFSMAQGRDDFDFSKINEWAAVLEMVDHKVKSKRSGGIVWRRARKGMELFDRDAVQTLKKSSATIRFDDKNYLEMAANSLVIIQRKEEDLLFKEKRSFMVVVDGELKGNITAAGEESVYIEVTTPGATTRIKAKDEKTAAEFKINVNKDRSSVVTVYSGTAEVEAQGEKVVVAANQSSRVFFNHEPEKPVELPAVVELLSPVDTGNYVYQTLPPKIWFRWKKNKLASSYHVMISRDPLFAKVILNEKLKDNYLAHGNLKKGEYYWRVSGLAEGGEGAFGQTRKISVVQDRMPPVLTVEMPPETVYSRQFMIKGKAERSSHIFIDNNRIPVNSTGEFLYELQLESGINVVIVEAIDTAGNVSFKSKLVNCKI
jgi:hypothetical protein